MSRQQIELTPEQTAILIELAELKGATPQELAQDIISTYIKKNKPVKFDLEQIPFSTPSKIDFSSNFVVTGEFESAKRSSIEATIFELGGYAQDRVTSETEYVVVGNKPNPAWSNGTLGGKLTKALKRNPLPIFIRESQFVLESERAFSELLKKNYKKNEFF